VEVHLHHAGRSEEALAGALAALAEREGARWAVAGDVRYLDAAGRRAFDVLLALRHGTTVADAAARGLCCPTTSGRCTRPAAVAERWRGRDAGVAATREVAALCDFSLGWARPSMPAPPGARRPHARHVAPRVRRGGGARALGRPTLPPARAARARAGRHPAARLLGVLPRHVGRRARGPPARHPRAGARSAANSAVAYVLGVTAVDPVRHGLLFERFLSAARTDGLTEAPDIDVDVEADRREQLLDYVYATYGRAHAAIACVVQTYSAPTAVQDVCRAYGVPLETARALSKRLHHVDPADGAAALAGDGTEPGLAAEHGLDVTTPRGRALLAAVAAFEGLPRLRSTHPGGFVLSAEPLAECAPVEPTTMGRTILQYDKDDLDALGVPKFDFLGLGALGAVRRAFDLLEQRLGERPAMYRLPPDDPATFALVADGETVGTFQVESRAQIASLVHTRPEKLYDLVVQVALIRPGPIVAKFVHPYTRRRRGLERLEYPKGMADLLAPILARTQGVPIFQEQAMALAMRLGGYTAAEADELRRTMGHQRKAARLAAAIEALRDRMTARGIDAAVAAGLADDLKVFANYGFPESHAWSFALIAYATCWLKAHHPAAFYAGLLDAQPMGFYSVASLVHDARRRGVEVRLPCLALGEACCALEERDDAPDAPALRVGWRQVRGLPEAAVARLTEARARAPFRSVADAVRRAALGRPEAVALARAHAFAVWAPDRRRAAWEALRAAGDALPLAPAALGGADGHAPPALAPHAAVIADYHALGLSVDGHPMGRYRAWCARVGALTSAQLARCRGGERVVAAGLVTVRQRPSTAKGTVFLLLEDGEGTANVIVPGAYRRARPRARAPRPLRAGRRPGGARRAARQRRRTPGAGVRARGAPRPRAGWRRARRRAPCARHDADRSGTDGDDSARRAHTRRRVGRADAHLPRARVPMTGRGARRPTARSSRCPRGGPATDNVPGCRAEAVGRHRAHPRSTRAWRRWRGTVAGRIVRRVVGRAAARASRHRARSPAHAWTPYVGRRRGRGESRSPAGAWTRRPAASTRVPTREVARCRCAASSSCTPPSSPAPASRCSSRRYPPSPRWASPTPPSRCSP
jgi:error-prone DNA polymerase